MSGAEDELRQRFSRLATEADMDADPMPVRLVRRKAKRRKAVRRSAVTALAVVATAVPVGLWGVGAQLGGSGDAANGSVQPTESAQDDTGEEQPQDVTVPETAQEGVVLESETDAGSMLPTVDDFIGTTIDLPSFAEGTDRQEEVDAVCSTEDVVLEDGTPAGVGPYDHDRAPEGSVWVSKTVFAAGAETAQAVLVGCEYNAEFIRQALLVEGDAENGWTVEKRVAGSLDGYGDLFDIGALGGSYKRLGLAFDESEGCCGGAPLEESTRVMEYRPGEEDELVDTSELPFNDIADVKVDISVERTSFDGWEAVVEAENLSDNPSVPFDVYLSCESLALLGWEEAPNCLNEPLLVASVFQMEGGAVYTSDVMDLEPGGEVGERTATAYLVMRAQRSNSLGWDPDTGNNIRKEVVLEADENY
ncbi:hypothetical protein [Salininema proteolyticum]|uniref:Uncharacterized protein n=1 Tax=Salininema proteolyticum TaxID=1607685 RepID=A0ABV8TYY6_9ACTN